MKALILLVATLSTVLVAEDTSCIGGTQLVTEFLADKDNLRCRDSSPIKVSNSELCSTADAFGDERDSDFYVMCDDGFTLVGYSSYLCVEGDLATALKADDVINPYSACVADGTPVCSDPQTMSDNTKLMVDSETPLASLAVQTADDDSFVYYKLKCGDGYDFKSGVEGPVYGYCTGSDGGNTYAFKDDVADGCYSTCPANGAVSTDVPNLASIQVVASRSGASVQATAICEDEFDLPEGAPETYTFTCSGVLNGDAEGGTFTCEADDCPVCVQACPANPEADQIVDAPSNLLDIVATESSAGQDFVAEVNCKDGFDLDVKAPKKYDFHCLSAEEDKTNGIVSVSGEAPVCYQTCPVNDNPNKESSFIDELVTTIIEGASHNEIKKGTIKCNTGFAPAHNHPSLFVCKGLETGDADDGEFHCVDECPVCEKTCAIPTDDTVFAYSFVGGEIEDNEVPAGPEGVVLSCLDDSLSLVGEKYLSCKDGALVYDNGEERPTCADAVVCEAPKVNNGKLDRNDNVLVGGSFKITCNPGHMFDTVTAKKYGIEQSAYEASLECTDDLTSGNNMPVFTCYEGCGAPDFQSGVISPDIKAENAAPYPIGAAVTFECLDGMEIQGKAEAVCDAGGIPEPICGSGAISFSLSVAALFITLLPLLL